MIAEVVISISILCGRHQESVGNGGYYFSFPLAEIRYMPEPNKSPFNPPRKVLKKIDNVLKGVTIPNGCIANYYIQGTGRP